MIRSLELSVHPAGELLLLFLLAVQPLLLLRQNLTVRANIQIGEGGYEGHYNIYAKPLLFPSDSRSLFKI